MATKVLDLEQVIDQDGYLWLAVNAPAYLTAIQNALTKGETPETIRTYVSQRVGPERQGLALRCEQAARHLQRMEG
jgi:hypothetical protein